MAKHGLYSICFQELISITRATNPDLRCAAVWLEAGLPGALYTSFTSASSSLLHLPALRPSQNMFFTATILERFLLSC